MFEFTGHLLHLPSRQDGARSPRGGDFSVTEATLAARLAGPSRPRPTRGPRWISPRSCGRTTWRSRHSDASSRRTALDRPSSLTLIDRLDRALELIDGIVRDAQAAGAVIAYCIGSTLRSIAHFRRGDLAEAEADARAALAAVADWPARPWAIAALLAALRERGDLPECFALLAAAPVPPPSLTAPCLLLERASVKLAAGDPLAALTDFRAAGQVGEDWGVKTPTLLPWRSGAALALGPGTEAMTLAREEFQLARVPAAQAAALRTLALVGPPDTRIGQLQAAAAISSTSPARLEHARTLVDLGAGLHRSGRRHAARQALAERPRPRPPLPGDRARAARSRPPDPGRRPPSPRAGARRGPLTASEKRTVDMAADGLTNREIARALFVTPKTVEAHLTRAYAKLGVRRRDELATALARIA